MFPKAFYFFPFLIVMERVPKSIYSNIKMWVQGLFCYRLFFVDELVTRDIKLYLLVVVKVVCELL